MTQYVLDTDHVTLLQYSNPVLKQRFEALNPSEVAVTAINVEELIQSLVQCDSSGFATKTAETLNLGLCWFALSCSVSQQFSHPGLQRVSL